MRKIPVMTLAAMLAAIFLAALYAGRASAELSVKANHNRIKVDYDYNGSTVGISGTADPGAELIVTVSSDETHQKLKEKSKVGGVLWMNTGDVDFERVPNVYYLRSTGEPDDMLAAEELSANAIGYQALLEQAEIESTDGAVRKRQIFDEFIKYKEANRLYSVSVGGFDLSEKDGRQDYRVVLDWAYQIPPGEYMVTTHAVKDGRVAERATAMVTVERAGVVKRLADMAQKNGALYGVVAIAIALVSGFGVGLIFRKGGGAH